MKPGFIAGCLAWAWLLGAPAPALAAAGSARLLEVSAVLQAMCEVQALSSHEAPLTSKIRTLLPPGLESRVDDHGNLIVELGPGDLAITVIAHQDEIGYEVKGVEADGRVSLTKKGGFLDFLYEGHPVVIGTARGPVRAVVAPRAGYLEPRATTEPLVAEELRLDPGTDSWAATGALGVRAGDPVTVAKRYDRMGATLASARSMDDRVGCTALLLALRVVRARPLARKVRFIFSTQEEVGLVGAEAAARGAPGAVCFAVDTFVSADSPLESQRFANAPLGEGCVIRAIDSSVITSRARVDRVLRIARESGVDIQVGLTGGGNDGSKYVVEGAADIPLAWPLRYSHSNAETVDLRDVASLADLIAALVQKY